MTKRISRKDPPSAATPADRAMLQAVLGFSLAATALLALGMLAYIQFVPPLLARLDVQIGEVLMREGIRFEAAGAIENAKERYALALQARFAGPQNRAYTLKQLGSLIAAEGDAEGAIPYLREAADSPHAPITVYDPLAAALLKLGKDAEIEALMPQWLAALDAHPNPTSHAAALYYQGRIAFGRGDDAAAEQYFDEAHALEPGGRGTAELASLYYRSARYAETIAAIDLYLQSGASGGRAEYMRNLRAAASRHMLQ